MKQEYLVTVHEHGMIEWRNKEGLLHRLDGPAVQRLGSGADAHYINGRYLTEENFSKGLKDET